MSTFQKDSCHPTNLFSTSNTIIWLKNAFKIVHPERKSVSRVLVRNRSEASKLTPQSPKRLQYAQLGFKSKFLRFVDRSDAKVQEQESLTGFRTLTECQPFYVFTALSFEQTLSRSIQTHLRS